MTQQTIRASNFVIRQVSVSLFLGFVASVSCGNTAWSQETDASDETKVQSRPNFVLMIADDMNWDDCGAYGHPAIRTPNLDRLSSEGLRFKYAYLTTNSCSPSRASIITGRYPHNTGAEQLHWPIPAGSATFTSVLRGMGYYTAAAGKWHMGDFIRDHFDKVYEASTAGFVLPSGKDGEPPKMIAEQPSGCEDWERALEERDMSKPFCMWLAALDPHREYTDGALDPPHRAEDVIVPAHLPDTADVREDLRLYYDEIGRLDTYVGKVIAKLGEQGVADNTLVLFISDNGRPFPRDKTTLYDGGIRTPWIVRWPDRVAAGNTTDALVSSVDIAATFLELAQGDRESAAVAGFPSEGSSFARVLTDPAASHRDFAFAEDHWHDYEDHARCIVDQRFKLIRNDYLDLPPTPSADAGRGLSWQNMLKLESAGELTPEQKTCFRAPRPQWELFDLQRDPGELKNLIDNPAYASVVARMKSRLESWTAQTGDYIPSKRTPDEFDRVTGEPDHSVRVRPRRSKEETFGTNGKY
ncbi:Arylsulfatase [Rubripirellula reticaptiva]|uniref:Arylsulfatase n=1 Tax=Rubripirellula reticaptiva TaxID=2528013 RepID=A0A5C6F2S6_9BACT|nr:Arylsulfatase [Rubripirellula reticaptiva]